MLESARVRMGAAISAHYNIAVNRTSNAYQTGITLNFTCKIGDPEHEGITSPPGDAALGISGPKRVELERERCRCEHRGGVASSEYGGLIFAPVQEPPALVNGEKEAQALRVITNLGLTGRAALSCVAYFSFLLFICELTINCVDTPTAQASLAAPARCLNAFGTSTSTTTMRPSMTSSTVRTGGSRGGGGGGGGTPEYLKICICIL
jgi:hypothetical protein